MNIDVNKFYRVRCGGAIQMEAVGKHVWYDKDGMFKNGYMHPLDLIAEISKQEYNRIVSGEAYESAVLDTAKAKMMEMHKEIEALKAENSGLQEGLKNWEKIYDTLKQQFIDYKNNRRFEAAKAAMQGMLAGDYGFHADDEEYDKSSFAKASVQMADALLKALEVK